MHHWRRLFCILSLSATILTATGYQHHHDQAKSPEGLEPGEQTLWSDPGDPSVLDFEYGIGGRDRRPQPPFRFAAEDLSGTSPKINVIDGSGAAWNVKWGHEVKPSIFCTRLIWACGYYAEPEYFVPSGHVEGIPSLKRAGGHISHDGSFVNARFQLRSGVPKFLDGRSWSWTANPFLNTHELRGLKILMLLVSNWDAKDARDLKSESSTNTNLGIFEDGSPGHLRYLYADDDWGSSLGKWGGTLTWKKGTCKGFADQTADFLKLGANGSMHWGFEGKHAPDLTGDITISDVQWLLKYLGRITDEQLRSGLTASGDSPQDTECYSRTLRQRIETLQQAAESR